MTVHKSPRLGVFLAAWITLVACPAHSQETPTAETVSNPARVKSVSESTPWTTGQFRWTVSDPLLAIDPVQFSEAAEHPWISVKDPSFVFHHNRWHLFCSLRRKKDGDGRIRIGYMSFDNWENAQQAEWSLLDLTSDYHGAPQIFWFEPHKLWYLIYQAADPSRGLKYGPCFSTNTDIAKAQQWTKPKAILEIPEGKKAGLDYWVICDQQSAYLFYTTLDGRMWRASTSLESFPDRGWQEPVIALQGDIFEASHTYKLQGLDRYLTFVEAQGEHRRYFKAYTARTLDGTWEPLSDAPAKPFVSTVNVVNQMDSWTTNYSHGELFRIGIDQKIEIDPEQLQLVFQGASDNEYRRENYGLIPWRLGILKLVSPPE